MHIKKIELEDIKSHQHFVQEFQRGTTAITGENGAGKTTIIEAIAWTLFDVLEYKKDDFVRRGAKKGVVRVTFESGLDGREYVVYRDTGTGYYVFDPSLKMRIADKKEEVLRFLTAHLGVEPGTDLKSLFQCAIGVPQGTFTSDFLLTTEKRKPIFDKLLRVEDYRKSAEKLRETYRFIEIKIANVRERIARAEGELVRFETVESELKDFQTQAEMFAQTLHEIEGKISEKNELLRNFSKAETRVNELKTALEILENERRHSKLIYSQKETEFTQAQKAAEKVELVREDYEKHLKVLGRLQELERERAEREKIQREIAKIETALATVHSDRKRFQADLERAQKAHLEIEKLKPQVWEQEKLERQRETLLNELAKAEAIENQIKSLTAKMDDLRRKLIANREEIREAEVRAKEAENLEKLEQRDAELTNELAGFRAKLEADMRFQREIKNGLCPILSEKCLNLKPGQTLESFVSSQFSELKAKISSLETEKKQLIVRLKNSREAGKFLAKLETLLKRKAEIETEGISYKKEMEMLQTQLENSPKLKKELTETEAKIRNLDNPKAKLIAFETDARRETELRENLTQVEKNLERLENELRIEKEKLENYRDLDAQWREFSAERDRTAQAYREFLMNENLARALPEKQKEFKEASQKLTKLTKDITEVEKDLEKANQAYDREGHLKVISEILDLEKHQVEVQANFANAQRHAEQLAAELEKLVRIRTEMQSEFEEKERLEKVAETTDFIRQTLKKSGPLVARNYIYHISLEANQMFREITNNAERTLKWTEDYGIVLEENGHERPFVNLSGGEQMAAALSVRLALLKQLSDVRLAFFDEPTTNMDAIRREKLAEQIAKITEGKTFDQLFVISHDDTFEEHVDNVVSVGEKLG